jgi:hypothetical protein
MTRHGVVLPIPDDSRIAGLIDEWPIYERGLWDGSIRYPRALWLTNMEERLRAVLPGHSSRDYNLTARSLAPFPLAQKDWL